MRQTIRCSSRLLALVLAALLPIALVDALPGQRSPAGESRDPQPMPATAALLRAFDRYRIVALGEAHWLKEEHDFLQSLLRDPAVSTIVQDIVVEFGNALYQSVMDRYIAGDPVPITEVQQAWRNCVNPEFTWSSPLYAQFFAAVREANKTKSASRRIRVWLGDPPVDWSKVQKKEDLHPFEVQRRNQLVTIVEREVLSKRRKALLIAGSLHLLRDTGMPPGLPMMPLPPTAHGPLQHMLIQMPPDKALVQYIEERHPGTTFVVMPHVGFGTRTAELEPRLAGWQKPMIALLRGTWLGAIEFGPIIAPNVTMEIAGKKVKPYGGRTLADLADAYLYLGPRHLLTAVPPMPDVYRDDAYFQEMNRRNVLKEGRPLNREGLMADAERGPRRFADIFK